MRRERKPQLKLKSVKMLAPEKRARERERERERERRPTSDFVEMPKEDIGGSNKRSTFSIMKSVRAFTFTIRPMENSAAWAQSKLGPNSLGGLWSSIEGECKLG